MRQVSTLGTKNSQDRWGDRLPTGYHIFRHQIVIALLGLGRAWGGTDPVRRTWGRGCDGVGGERKDVDGHRAPSPALQGS